MPRTIVPVSAVAAEFVQLVPVPPAPARVESSFITIEVGLTLVSVLLIRSFTADNDASPFGVTKHEQQATSSSSGEKA
jgi:hypothetical protein